MLDRIWKKIVHRQGFGLLSITDSLLWILSLLYRVASVLHRLMVGAPVRAAVPVISVGNTAVGGSGKTPIVAYLAQHLIERGIKVGLVSSGYGRSNPAPLLALGSELQRLSADQVGDEVLLLSHLLPVAVFAVDTVKAKAAVRLGESKKVDVIIVDDGFQHFRLARDLDIVTFDASVDQKLLHLLPYGVLREPLSALGRADIVILTRAESVENIAAVRQKVLRLSPEAEIDVATFSISELVGRSGWLSVSQIAGMKILAFAGIGNFEAFRKQMESLTGCVIETLEFPDHERYGDASLKKIRHRAIDTGADLIVTTGKDWYKLGDFDFGRKLYYVRQTVNLESDELTISGIINRLGLTKRNH
ncbi:MAG TPA: tetraacyldisaccharide 4'-kinase [Candidatus Acidoferrum sp.]|nr:tetraacyldisaccharide 4'-kinase [Candidatus Acidoferrum sp.]